MPYIKDENKGKFEKCLKVFRDSDAIDNVGELNYFITNILLSYIKHRGLKYETLNGVHGVLSCINSEIQNRITAPYERKKISENGDLGLFEELTKEIPASTKPSFSKMRKVTLEKMFKMYRKL